MPRFRATMRAAAIVFSMAILSVLSCGREVSGPTGPGVVNAFKRTGLFAIEPRFETALPAPLLKAAVSQVPFTKVHVVIRREDGTIAVDKFVDFPDNESELTLTLDVPLPANASSSGTPMRLQLDYVDASGQVVFSGTQPITVTPSTGSSAPPPSVSVPLNYTGTGAKATDVRISPRTAGGDAGQTATFTAQALLNNAVQPGTPIVFSSSDINVVTVNATSGLATFVGRGKATVFASLLTGPSDGAEVTVTLPASRFNLERGDAQSAAIGATLPTQIVAKVLAADGVGVANVPVSFAASDGGSVSGASAVSESDGTIRATWKLGSLVGSQRLTITSGSLPGKSLVVNATGRSITANKLVVQTQPTNGTAATPLNAIAVSAMTTDGTLVPSFTGDITVALGANTAGATLSGTTTVSAINGVATFSNLRINKPGTGYTLVFSATDLSGASTTAFNITAGSATRLIFGTMPSAVDAGVIIAPPVTVTAVDDAGNTATGFTGTVTLAVGAGPSGATLGGTISRAAVAGVATFGDLTIARGGTGFTLKASASGLPDATSTAFNVAAGVPTGIAILSGGGQTAQALTALAPITIQVRDGLGNGVADAAITVSVSLGGGSVTPTSVRSDATGQATLSWTLGSVVGAQSLLVTSGTASASIGATATAPPGPALAFQTAPASTLTAGVPFGTFTVKALTVGGAINTGFTAAVTASIASGPAGATLSGVTSSPGVAGVATFSNLRLTKAGTYTLTFSSPSYIATTTSTITVSAAPAKFIVADSGNGQTAGANATLPTKLVALVTDSVLNPVSGIGVTWAVVTGGGSLAGSTTTSDANGRVRATWTLGALPSQSVTVSSAGLTGSPVTFLATASGGVATTTLNVHLDTLISFGAGRSLTATAKDALNNTVAGSWTWLSRTTSAVTVNASGVLTGVANGSSWIVATEAGGTKDSALIVVQQRVATVNVTPGTRNIYKTRTFTFTASAVDGNGNAVAGASAPAWNSTAPSTATVNATTGVVTALSLGSTNIQAVINGITGTATVTVLTPITRIVVGRDSASVPVSDTTSLTSLGIGRAFRAEAHDTLDAVMSGVTFTWSSSNVSVALIDSTFATRAHALSVANGQTSIQASADNVTGSMSLKVQQVLASIELTPTPDSVGVAGTKQMTARGKDANNRYLSSGTYTYASSTPAVATVNPTTGVVTGVALGTTNITATSGAITSNAGVIKVTSVVPGIISFGRDTLTVGRGNSVSIPVLLSRANASSVTVNLAARDTNAYFSVGSVTIPSGQTSANVTLNGRNAGTTVIYATDGSGTGFAGDTAAVAVQANMRLASSGWTVNAGDQVSTQVLLSDPSPAGGTYVTFSYGTPNRATVSPDPAFIPAGQLASNIVITSLGTTNGSTTITPVATGVNGTASTLSIYAPVLTISAGSSALLGSGQYESGWYVYTPTYTVNPQPLTFVSTDTNIVTVSTPNGTSIPGGSYYVYFTVAAKAPGTASVIVSSPGWTPDTLLMRVSSPRITTCCGVNLVTTSPVQSFTAYSTDSVGTGHYRTSALALTVSSSDTTVIKIIDKTPVIAAGAYYASGIRYQPGGAGGSAYLKVVAGGHRADSILVNVAGPKLEFSFNSTRLGKDQNETGYYIYAPNNVTSALTVNLVSSNPAKVTVPATVTIPSGSYYAYFTASGIDTGTVSLTGSAAGYSGDTATLQVTSPRLTNCCGGTYNNFSNGPNYTVYSTDSVGTGHYRNSPLTVTLVSRNPAVVTIDSSTVTIGTGAYYHNSAHISIVGVGSTYIVATAPGHKPDSVLYTVQTPKLNFNFTTALVGRRQYFNPTDFYIYTPDYRTSALPVTMTQTNAAADSLSTTSFSIANGTYYQYFGLAGRSTGVDTLIISAPGYLPDTAYVRIGPVKLTQCCMPSSALTTSAASNITVYATDSVGNAHYLLDSIPLVVTSSDTTVIKPTQRVVKIAKGGYYVYAGYSYFGPGTAHLTFTDTTGAGYGSVSTSDVTVTGPSLIFSNTNAMYGMRQHGSSTDYYVYTQNNVASNTVVNLVSTDPRVATVPATVTIPAGSYYAYFTITAQDTVGTIQIQANASGFGPPTPINVQVTQPKFLISTNTSTRTTAGPQSITVYATDINGNGHYVNEPVTVALASSNGTVATVDSTTVTIPVNQYYHNTAHWNPVAVGSVNLTAVDNRATLYKYNTGTASLSVVTPSLSLSWNSVNLGLGQYIDQSSYCCYYVSTPDYMASNTTVTLSHLGTARTSTPATTTIPSSNYYSYFRIDAASVGTDTLRASIASPFHNADTAYVVVDTGRIDNFSGWPGASMHVGDSVLVTLYTRDAGLSAHSVIANTTFTVAPSSPLQIHVGNANVTSVTVPANTQQVTFYLKAVATGTGSAVFTNAQYKPYTPPNVTVIP